MVKYSVSSAAAEGEDMELDMSVDSVEGKDEEEQENELLIDSDDDNERMMSCNIVCTLLKSVNNLSVSKMSSSLMQRTNAIK